MVLQESRVQPEVTILHLGGGLSSWSQDLMKLRFFTSCHRKISVRDKVIGKKWIYLERYTFHRQNAILFKR